MEHSHKEISFAVERAASLAGSQKALASHLGVSPQAVWAWIRRGSIPATYCAAIEALTGGAVTRKRLRPNDFYLIWPELSKKTKLNNRTKLRRVNRKKCNAE